MTKILSKEELRKLMRVPTTIYQAEEIIERNTKALDALRKNKVEIIRVGCPHCVGDCNNCAYPYDKKDNYDGEQCLNYEFGGLTYDDICEVISISPHDMKVQAGQIEGSLSDQGHSYEELKGDAERWLLGHIEWAEAVINEEKEIQKAGIHFKSSEARPRKERK